MRRRADERKPKRRECGSVYRSHWNIPVSEGDNTPSARQQPHSYNSRPAFSASDSPM
jgi:hypothetical protein